MASGALFIGWGPAARGRERQALQVFDEVIQYYARLQQEGAIDSFEPVALEPHGGDLAGFVLLRGDRERLGRLRASEEFVHNLTRGQLVVDRLGVVAAYTGEELTRLFADFRQQAAELAAGTP